MTDSEKVHFLTEGIYRVGAVLFYFGACFIFVLIAEEKSQNQVSSFITAEIFVRILAESAASLFFGRGFSEQTSLSSW